MRRWAVALALVACGPKNQTGQKNQIEVPARRSTGGDPVLRRAPSGADAVLEIDLARLRLNPTIGPLVRSMTGAGEVGGDLVAVADLVVVASYRIGETDAGQLVFAAGPEVDKLKGAHRVSEQLVAFGPPALLRRVDAVGAGHEPPLADDRALLQTRAQAMPEKATGASLRMAARLGFEARLALAKKLEIELVPEWLSVWLDVADDLAGVAILGGGADADPQELAVGVGRLRDRVAAATSVRRLGLGPLLEGVRVAVEGRDARVVVVVGPRRLARLVALVMDKMEGQP
jgi:hypothetical protein